MTPPTRQDILALLRRPDGVFGAAVDRDAVLVPMPAAVRCTNPVPGVTDRALEMFAVADWPAIVHAWGEALNTGCAAVTVHLVDQPDSRVDLFMGDFRDEHGVLLVAIQTSDVSAEDLGSVVPPPSPPRTCVLRYNRNMVIVDADEAATAMLGWERHELIGQRGNDRIHPADHARMLEARTSLSRGPVGRRARVRCQRKDGSWMWVEVAQVSHLDEADPHILITLFDVSEEMATLAALQERELLLSRLAQALPEGLLQIDTARRVVFFNDQLHAMLGTAPGADLATMVAAVAPSHRGAVNAAVTAALCGAGDADLEVDIGPPVPHPAETDLPATTRHCRLRLRALVDADAAVTGVLVCVSDITEAVQLRRDLENRATYDALTGCHNRASALAVLHRALAGPAATRTAVAFVDVDGLKPINDRLGHAAGDQVLVAVAGRLRHVLRGEDVVGRMGGDEFLVICHDVPGDDEAAAVGRRIERALADDVAVSGQRIRLRTSIGIARGAVDMGEDELVRRADQAMYRSKRRGLGEPVLAGAATDDRRRRGSKPPAEHPADAP